MLSRDAVVDTPGGPFTIFDLPDVGSTGTINIEFDPGAFGGDCVPDEFTDISALLPNVSASF